MDKWRGRTPALPADVPQKPYGMRTEKEVQYVYQREEDRLRRL